MTADANTLMELLDLEGVQEGVFMGPPAQHDHSRVFGGQSVGQALAAACFTVDGRSCHSLHAYFVRPGIPGRPSRYEVVAFNDGKRLSTRQVVGIQRDEPTLLLSASFQGADGASPEQQMQAPETPGPEQCPDRATLMAEMKDRIPEALQAEVAREDGRWPVEMRFADPYNWLEPTPRTRTNRVWMRIRGQLPDAPNIHRCALAYASDLIAIHSCLMAAGLSFLDGTMQIASLDHALWFHRPFRADEYLLFALDSVSVGDGRGLARGDVFDQQGRLVASMSQEALIHKRG